MTPVLEPTCVFDDDHRIRRNHKIERGAAANGDEPAASGCVSVVAGRLISAAELGTFDKHIMTYAEFQESWEIEAGKESDSYMALSTADLIRQIHHGEYGQYFTIWRAVAAKCDLSAVVDKMLEILKSDLDYLIRYHCAEALISLSGGYTNGFRAVQLSGRRKYDVDRHLKEFEDYLKNQKK